MLPHISSSSPQSCVSNALGFSGDTGQPLQDTSVRLHGAHQFITREDDKPWVLCIDDDQDFLYGLKRKLQSRGYDVIRASEGQHGYRYAFEFDPVMILLDLHMPHMSGEEILAKLIGHPETAQIPVLIVTGLNEDGLEYRLRGLGAHSVIRKPVEFSVIADAVDGFLRRDERY